MNQTTTVRIQRLEGGPDALLHHYAGQAAPQPCYIALDLYDGRMWADYNAEIGNAVPFDVWHGIVRRYSIPVLQPATVNVLMQAIAPYAQRVLDDSEVLWDGSNHVARLGRDAEIAEEAICEPPFGILAELESDVYTAHAAEWLGMVVTEVREQIAGGHDLDWIYDEFQGDGSHDLAPVILDLMPYLEMLKAEVED